MRHRLATWLIVFAILAFPSAAQSKRPPNPNQTPENVQRWDATANLALDIALNAPGTDMGRDAIYLFLRAVNERQYLDPPPVEFYERLAKEAPKLVKGYCRKEDLEKYPEPCETVFRIHLDVNEVLGTRSCGIYYGPPKTPEQIQKEMLQQANSHLQLWEETGIVLCSAKHPSCKEMAPLLRMVTQELRYAHQSSRAMEVRDILLDPKYSISKSWDAKEAIFEGAEDLEQSLLDFEQAAQWYERLAREFPHHEKASEALIRATRLRLLLNDEDSAQRNAEFFEKRFGRLAQSDTARIMLTIAGHALRTGRWADAQSWLEKRRALFEQIQDIDVRIVFHTFEARIALEKGRQQRAIAEYDDVRRTWVNLSFDAKAAAANEFSTRTQETIVKAVGEADFFFAQRTERNAKRTKALPDQRMYGACIAAINQGLRFDHDAQHCEQWLSSPDSTPFRAMEELRDEPFHVTMGIQASPMKRE